MPKLGRRNEVTELDYQTSMAVTTRDAPFGTENTPNLKDKIIGGRYVSVLERPVGQNLPRYEKLSLVSDKPNHVDPRALTDFSKRYNPPYQDGQQMSPNRGYRQYENQTAVRPSNFITKRPDSKDISSRFPTLPPIEENRLKNHQISTVFEPEAWTRQYRSDNKENYDAMRPAFNSRDSGTINGFRPHYATQGSSYSEPRQGSTDKGVMSSGEFMRKLATLLPRNQFLPDKPIILTEDDEARLIQVIAEDLRNHSPLKLRDIYLDIANTSDKNLSGYCQYQELYYSMSRQMLNMSGDLLQVTAAMFVSPDRPNRDVNYEKFLSFVGLALKQADRNRGAPDQRPRTPVERQVENYFADSEQAKLVSMVEQQLNENEYIIDFSKLEHELSMADRRSKGILDLRTIMDVCYQLNIPLQSSVLNRVLQRCRLNTYDDRYSWRTFIEFLGKAQPPRVRSEPVHKKPSPSPVRSQRPPSPLASKQQTPLWRRHEEPSQTNGYNGYKDDQGSRTEVISRMDQDIKQLERNYEDMRDQMRPRNDAPWFKNFMEFANALYTQDQRHDGDLPAEDVYRWTKMYNDTGNLGIPDHLISKALSDASKGGKVHIHSYLTRLGNVASHEKII